MPLFALIDCNNFFASCERVFDPYLNGKPVVVLSNNDGCIVARSNEVKALGIPMGAPYFQWRTMMLRNNVHVFSSNFALYGDMSRRVMDVLASFLPEECFEVYSVDEAFMNLDCVISPNLPLAERQEKILAFAHTIRQTVRQWTGIPVSVGIAPTKTLAKAANKIAKRNAAVANAATNGVFACLDESTANAILAAMPVSDVWGVGRKLSEAYKAHSITTALDLKNAPEEWIRKRASITGWRTQRELQGVSCIRLEHAPAQQQTIVHSRSFRQPVHRVELVQEAVATFAGRAAEKLRRLNLVCGCISVSMRTSRFSPTDYFSKGGETLLPFPTDSTIDLVQAASVLVERIYVEGHGYKKASVTLLDLSCKNSIQTDIFAQTDSRHDHIMHTMDALNTRFGAGTLRLAAAGSAPIGSASTGGAAWRGANDERSQRYTTHWGELKVVQA
jgi:DNA polymerase V